MADATMVYDVIAHDKASSKIDKVRARTLLLTAAVGGLAIKVGKDSVKAYIEAEESQKKLSDALERFPKTADTNIDRLRALNTTLARKTKYDDDAFASGQAVIAQFGLTGKQIEEITPIIADYASRTGKDIPAAAMDIGKAMLGNAKALKNIGIKYQATGDTAKDFTNIQELMRKQVGGFAEKEGQTAAGRAAILKNQYGELQETLGSKLVPTLLALAGVLLSVVGFVQDNATASKIVIGVVGGLTVAIYGLIVAQRISAFLTRQQTEQTILYNVWTKLTAAATKVWAAGQWLLNAALTANPIGLVVVAIGALVAGIVIAYKRSETFRNIVGKMWDGLKAGAKAAIGFVLGMLDKFLGAQIAVLNFMAKLPGPLGKPFKVAADAVQKAREKIWGLQGDLKGIKPAKITIDSKDLQIAATRAADLKWQLDHIPKSVTVNAVIRAQAASAAQRQHGGPVSPGHAYVVGERRAELFVPDRPGRIEPRVSGSRADADYLAERIGQVVLAGMNEVLRGTANRGNRLARA